MTAILTLLTLVAVAAPAIAQDLAITYSVLVVRGALRPPSLRIDGPVW